MRVISLARSLLEVSSRSLHSGFNFIIRKYDVVKKSYHSMFLKLGQVEFFEGVVGLL